VQFITQYASPSSLITQYASPSSSSKQTIRMKKNYPVTNMSCANCALGVEKALINQPGVTKASVNFASNIVTLEYEQGKTSPQKLKQVVQSIGYDMIIDDDEQERLQKQDEQSRKHYKELKRNTILSWVFSVPIMVISMIYMGNSNDIQNNSQSFINFILLIFSLPVLILFGRNFFVNGWKHAITGKANMDTLVALSTSIAFLFSVFNTFFPQFWTSRGMSATVYYEAATMIISFVLLGKLLEDRAKGNTSAALKKLMGLQPKEATVLKDGNEQINQEDISDETLENIYGNPLDNLSDNAIQKTSDYKHVQTSISQIKIGDMILVKPGEKIPVDGTILRGNSYVDESAITGESVAVEKSKKDKVLAGTINQKGSFIFQAEKVGGDTLLGQIIRMVRDAQGSKAPVQRIVDKIASIFVPVVISISILTLILWLAIGGSEQFSRALLSAVSVLVIACPCALGLATPTALMVGIGKAAQQHILIKDATALEQMKRVNTIVLDKTGTLTEGRPAVTDWIWDESAKGHEYDSSDGELFVSKSGQKNRRQLQNILLELEKRSEHPLASAIVEYLESEESLLGLSNKESLVNQEDFLDSFYSVTGMGVEVNYSGNNYWAGNQTLVHKKCGDNKLDNNDLINSVPGYQKVDILQHEGKSVVIFGKDKEILAIIAIADKIKETSIKAVKELKKRNRSSYAHRRQRLCCR